MMIGPKQPSGHGGGRGKGRRRRPHQGKRGPQQGGQGGHGNRQNVGGIYTAPMDHSYRAAIQGQAGQGKSRIRGRSGVGGMGTQYLQPEPEPLPAMQPDAVPRIFAFVEDLFFSTKIREVARKLNVPVEFVKTSDEVLDKVGQNGEARSSLVIFDLNNANIRPLSAISKLKSRLKKKVSVIGFLSHVQGELKLKAQEAGCDMVVPRSAFSQNLPQLLRRHGAPMETEEGL